MKPTLLILTLVLLGLLVSGVPVAAQDNPSPQLPLSTAEPTTAPVSAATTTLSALGSVEANQVAALQFQTMGTVKAVYVQLGDYVQAGEVLADLEDTDAWQTYNQALLNLESAQISMNTLLEPASEEDIQVAKANITSAQAAYSSAANPVSESQLASAQISYDNAVLNQQALEQARRNMNGSANDIAQTEAQIGAAAFNTEIARLQLEELQNPDTSSLWSASLRIKQAELQLEQLQEGPTEAQLANAQLAIDRAQATVLSAQTALEQVQLVAPLSGYVTAVNIAAGDAVTAATVAVEISDLSRLTMTVPINELDIDLVQEGLNATIALDALPDVAIPGTVDYVGWVAATSSDGIVTYDVQVVLNTTDPQVRLGMTGEVTIATGSANS